MIAPEPQRRLAVITCMDARIDPLRGFGFQLGEAHVLRNAGGIVTDDVLRSLLVSQRLLGTRDVMVVQHSGCGMLAVRDEELAAEVERESGVRPPMPLGGFSDIDESVRASVQRIRDCAYLPHRDGVRGFVYELEEARLRAV